MKESERLFETVETIRVASYPDLDAALVHEVLTHQVRMQDDRAEARKLTAQAVTRRASELAAQHPDAETSAS